MAGRIKRVLSECTGEDSQKRAGSLWSWPQASCPFVNFISHPLALVKHEYNYINYIYNYNMPSFVSPRKSPNPVVVLEVPDRMSHK